MACLVDIQGVAKFSATMNSKTSKHRIPLTSLWLNHFKSNQQRFQVLYVGVTVSSLPSRFLGAMAVLEIWMIFTWKRRSAVKATPCFSLKWRLLARVARSCLSSAIHFFGLRISPSCSEIFNRRRISIRSSCSVKFLGRHGKIEVFFISNPWKYAAYILINSGLFGQLFDWNTLTAKMQNRFNFRTMN